MKGKNHLSKVDYNEWWEKNLSNNIEEPGTAYRINLIKKRIALIKPKNLVDAGCGSAQLLKKIYEDNNLKNISLSGFDVSEKIIALNKKKFPKISFFYLDLNKSNQDKKGQYELLISTEVIEHLENWSHALKKMLSLVKNGGYIILTTQSGKIFNHHKKLGHLKHFKKIELEKELLKNGCKILESRYCGWPFMNLKNLMVNMFYRKVEKKMMNAKKQSLLNKIIFRLFGILYQISLKNKGPQIFILGKKQ